MTLPAPSPISEKDIEKAVDEYLTKAPLLLGKVPPFPEENLPFGRFGQEKYLLISKFKFHTLPIKLLKRLPIYLIREFKVQVELDSKWFWALTTDVSLSSAGFPILQKWELNDAFKWLMTAHFADLYASNPHHSAAIDRLNQAITIILSRRVLELVAKANNILMYICYPVLEGIAKFAMSSLIDSDGKVVGDGLKDGRQQFKKGCTISSLAKILRCLEISSKTDLSKPELSTNLRDFRLEVEKMNVPKHKSDDDGWDSIYHLRNVSLHGKIGWQLRSGLMTNLICLILWHLFDETAVQKELEMIDKLSYRRSSVGYYYPQQL